MVSSGMLRRVALVRTHVSEELSASFIRVTRIGELGTKEAQSYSETSIPTRTTRRNIPEDTFLCRIISFDSDRGMESEDMYPHVSYTNVYQQPIRGNEYQKHKNNVSGE
jgi:hypothetical protein